VRPYYNYDRPPPRIRFAFTWTKAVKVIIIVTAGAYLLGHVLEWLLHQPGFVVDVFGYRWTDLVQRGWIWQPITYMFVHADLGHIFFNMLMLFFFGGPVERRLGRRNFIIFYFACGLGGAALGSFYSVPLIGASGATYGVLIAFAVFNPDARLWVFFMFPVKARYVALGMVFFSVAGAMSSQGDVAHLAHLGGVVVAAAWIWGRPVWGRLTAGVAHAGMERRRQRSAQERQEMDRILTKVHQEGIHSLRPGEKRFLKKMSKQYREP